MKKISIFLLLLCGFASAQTGSSIYFDTSSTSTCKSPTKGLTVLCGTPSIVTVSFDGAAPVTLPAKGLDGQAATVTIGAVASGAIGAAPKVTNSGTASAAVLNFTFPAPKDGTNGVGAPGIDGKAATVAIGNVVSGPVPSVSNAGTANAAVLNFVLPKGDAGTATLTSADCSLLFTGQATTDGSVAVRITCK